MSLIKDRHTIELEGHEVTVHGSSGKVHSTWVLSIDGQESDEASAAGDFNLRGVLPSGTPVEAAVHQSLLGPTKVTFRAAGEDVQETEGFVA